MAHELCKVNNKTCFDYTILDLSSAPLDHSTAQKILEPENSKKRETSQDSSHGIFAGRFEMFAKNKHICDRLKRETSLREEEQMACFEETRKGSSILEVRRRCFCESIGRKFCASCRHKLNKEMSLELPRILVNVTGSKSNKGIPKDMFMRDTEGTPEPSLPILLKQASGVILNTDTLSLPSVDPPNSPTSMKDDSSCVSSIVPDVPGIITNYSPTSTITIPKDPSNATDDPNSHCSSPVIPELPNVEDIEYVTRNNIQQIAPVMRDEATTLFNDVSYVTRNQRSSIAGQSVPGLPLYSYPVEPVLMDLKYINFSIYDKKTSS